MKHPLSITALLLVLFFTAQVIGLSLLSMNIQDIKTIGDQQVVEHASTALGERPDTEGVQSLLYLLLGVAIGTGLVLLLIRFKVLGIWKIWFLVAVWFSTTIALGVLIPTTIALLVCLGLAVWKVYWPNPVIHNLTEVFMYAGLAVLLVPIFSLMWVIILLVIISIYDVIAVWHSKHMVVMAQAQTESKLFAGLYVPKNDKGAGSASLTPPEKTVQKLPRPAEKRPERRPGSSAAILGGGDIAFPLIFSGVVMDWLIINNTPRVTALVETLVISAVATVALALLFAYAKKDKFYPAMPVLTFGCLVGLGIVLLMRAVYGA